MMKKNPILYIMALLLIGLATSCNNFLDELPRGIVIAKTTSDFRKLLDNVGNQRFPYSLSQVSGCVDVVSDDVQVDSSKWLTWRQQTDFLNKLYAFETEVWGESTVVDDVNWKNQYHIVSLTGTILIELAKVTDNPTVQQQLMAEARVHRAYAYLHLVNIYAKHYDAATAASDMGVPMYENAASLPSLERKSVQVVYDYIIQELNESYDALPDQVSMTFSHRPTQVAVDAILARVYLYMGNYEQAQTYASKVLSKHSALWDYNAMYTGLDRIPNLIGISRLEDKETILHKTTAKGAQRVQTYYILDTANFNALYPDYTVAETGVYNNIDLRRSLWFNGFTTNLSITGKQMTFGRTWNSWYKKDGTRSTSADYLDISTPEMLLIRAECQAREGALAEALADINQLRKHRFKTDYYTPVTVSAFGNDPDRVLQFVLDERRRELYGKELRLFDIKRLGLPVTHTLNGRVLTLEPHSPKLVWSIFDAYIDLNPEIIQNER